MVLRLLITVHHISNDDDGLSSDHTYLHKKLNHLVVNLDCRVKSYGIQLQLTGAN